MHPHTPQERRAYETPDWTPPESQGERTRIEDRTRYSGTATMVSVLVLIAIIVLVVVL